MRKLLWLSRRLAVTAILFIAFGHAEARILNVPEDYQTIQAGIDASRDGDTVLVQPGTYEERLVLAGQNIVLGSLLLVTGDSSYIDSTAIDAAGMGIVIDSGNDPISFEVRGLMIQNGGNGGETSGTAIITGERCRALFQDLIIKDTFNEGQLQGVAMSAWGSRVTIRRVKFTNNSGGLESSIFSFFSSQIVIEDCQIFLNQPGYSVFDIGDCNFVMRRSVIANNPTEAYEDWQIPQISLYFDQGFVGSFALDQVSIIGSGPGGLVLFASGMDERTSGTLMISNSILLGEQDELVVIARDEPAGLSASLDYNDIEDGENAVRLDGDPQFDWGDGNIDSDPLFADPDNGDFHLTADSPCIDAGDPEAPLDPDGTRADMGAFYFHQRDIEVEPRELHFPPVPWGELDSLPVVIRNAGLTPLHIDSIPPLLDMSCITVRPEGYFDPPLEIAPDSALTLWFFIRPDSSASLEKTVLVYSDDPDEHEVTIIARGERPDYVPSDILHSSLFTLHSAYPNPFNSTTTIRFSMGSQAAPTRLAVYDLSGRMVADLFGSTGVAAGQFSHPAAEGGAGEHSVVWNAEGLGAGIYVCKLTTPEKTATRKLLLVK